MENEVLYGNGVKEQTVQDLFLELELEERPNFLHTFLRLTETCEGGLSKTDIRKLIDIMEKKYNLKSSSLRE